ncbi:hypothetical protein JKG40_10895 [Acidithiobacillus sp. PG05]|jgi:hypothetical protein|uniref:Uncharacterized protein n=1 Tax=Acidithiobacillus ferrooxidans (strain ATCC 23270 / DSM 14882 / CIP 104768 / NCIMB 8455) TaxID=243159 RepID=B7J8C3_ACIF2|nr:hypothetical protein AFE_2691 [Acidithiobacillus ferrooxidans ATCC 23270]EGQ60467.1 hypothetical protein GGI1_00635 [Acidithiobacillus sp. GGI-221]MBN6748533.1 hypothetical protein [Acidithiobacillus sp. PG05]MBU2818681.1 hypothetical protein [Acidithiobacillus ferrooxidans]
MKDYRFDEEAEIMLADPCAASGEYPLGTGLLDADRYPAGGMRGIADAE